MNVLIVEDSKSVAAATKKITEAQGYKAICFPNGIKALEWLKQNTADLMVVDYNLPDMTGKEFIEKVATRHVPPFIVSTGRGSERVAVEMMRLGAKDYVLKDQLFQEMLPLVIKRVTHAINDEKRRQKAEEELARSERKYRQLVQQSAMAIAIHKIITNEEGKPIDYQFVEANNAFEDFTGLKPENIVGKTVREVLPGIEKSQFDWIGFYGKIALEGGNEEFEQYSEPLDRWYKVYAYGTDKYYFTTVFADTTLQHMITESSRVFNSYSASSIDYEFILKQMQGITGAKYAALNIFDENKEFTTTAFTGINESIKKATAILGIQFAGQKWKHNPDREEKIRASKTTIFKDLIHLTGKTILRTGANILMKTFNLGQVVIIKSMKETEPIGDFTLIFEKNTPLQNQKTAEVFADLTGMLIARIRAEEKIKESEKLQRSLLENIAAGIIIIDPETREIEIVNTYAQQLIGLPENQILGKRCHQFVCPAHEECCPICDKDQDVDNADKTLLTATGKEIPILKTVKKIIINGKEKLIESFVEITEKKATEELLKKSDELLKKLSAQIPGVIYQYKVHPDGTACFPFATENIYEIYEVQPHEVKTDATPVLKRLHPDDFKNVVASINKSKENLSKWEDQYRVILPKKGERWLHGTANPEKQDDGSVLWHGHIFDYTEIKEIQLETEKIKEQFELAVAGTNDGIWDWDIKTNALFLSKRWKEMLGYEDHELKNHLNTFFQLVYAEDMPSVEQHIQDYLSAKIPHYSLEFKMVHKDGSTRWILAKGETLRDKNGIPYRMAGSHSDITDRKEMEEKLRENTIRLQLAMDAGEHGFWDWNLVSNNTFFSPTYYTMLGYEDRELPMNLDTFMQLIHPEDAQKVMPVIQRSIEKAKPYEEEFRLQCKDGSYKWVMGKGKAYFDDQSGKPNRAVGVHIDINERKMAANELCKKNKMLEETTHRANDMAAEAEKANAAKSEFLANMSHEIRTPMNSILGFSEIMLNTTTDNKQKDFLKTILNSGQTLLSLINDILDLSKIEAGKMDISYEPIDLRLIISDITRLFSQNAADKNIELITEIDENFPRTILIDEIRLRQILLNITGNAIKFTNRGYVKITLLILDISNDTLSFEIIVEDTGIGIAPQQQKLIFESFRQASGQDSRQYSGTGLGLSISKKLIELMNGEIHLASEPGKGSTFTIVFKNIHYSKNTEEKQNEYMWDDDVLDFNKQIVLVVDDLAYNRQLVVGYLENNNLLIYEAENGMIAIEAARNYRPDLILMDIRMPVMDGYQATEIIKNDPALKNIPVVALTASTMKSQNEDHEKLFNGILHKPIKKQSLIHTLTNHLKHKKTKTDTLQPNDNSIEAVVTPHSGISEKIIEMFNNQLAANIEDHAGYVILDELDTLIGHIKEFSVKHKVNALEKPLEKLKHYRDDYDLKNIQETLYTIKNLFR